MVDSVKWRKKSGIRHREQGITALTIPGNRW